MSADAVGACAALAFPVLGAALPVWFFWEASPGFAVGGGVAGGLECPRAASVGMAAGGGGCADFDAGEVSSASELVECRAGF